jgi:hypothetical protein
VSEEEDMIKRGQGSVTSIEDVVTYEKKKKEKVTTVVCEYFI